MPDDIEFEIEQARDAFSKLGTATTVNVAQAGRYLQAAIAASESTGRKEWDSLFAFWRTLIRGGWPCPSCGGQMTHGEASGVRCTSWQCVWVPGRPQ